MQVPCLYGPRKSKPKLKSELRKQQYAATLFDCNYLAHVIVLWQKQNLCVTVQFFICVVLFFNLRAISEYKLPGACIWRGDLWEGFLPCDFGGLLFGGPYTAWRGLFRNFKVFIDSLMMF